MTFAQNGLNRVESGVAEEWRTQFVRDAIELDSLFGAPQNLQRVRSLKLWQPDRQKPLKEVGSLGLFSSPISARPQGADAIEPRAATALPVPPHQLEGFIALADDNTANPPDAAGAVSPDHILTALNSEFRIQDRKGMALRTLSNARFWAPLGPFKSFLTDPRVAWDSNAKRFIMIILADIGESSSGMLIARSTTSDPLGEWRMTRVSPGALGRDFDFPIMAIAGRSLAISVDVYKDIFYEKTLNYVMPLANVLSATEALNFRTFEDFLGSNAPAADADPNRDRVYFVNNSYFLSSGSYAIVFKMVRLPSQNEILVGPLQSANAGEIGLYNGGERMPQLGTDLRINAGDATIQNCIAKSTSVWCVNTLMLRFAQEYRSVVQYYRFNWPDSGDPTIAERVRIDDITGENYYGFPSIAVNRNNDIFIGYNRFNKSEYAGSFFATRKATDPPGALYFDGRLKAGEDSFTRGLLRNRWGDYSTTVVDPVDNLSFWTLQEYAASRTESGSSLWGTYWAKYSPRLGVCTVRLDRSSVDLPSTGGIFRITATPSFPDCQYLTNPNASWIQSLSSSANVFEFRVGVNRLGNTRTATISLAGEVFIVRQAANPNPPAPEPVLSVVKFDAPVSARVGDSLSLSATVRNTGTRGAGRFRIGFYLSTKTPVTNRDTFTGVGCPQNQGLVTDEVASCTGSYQLDSTLQPGTYYLAAIA